MKLLRLTKSVSLFFVVMMVGVCYPMNQVNFISRKESNFDFLALRELGVWYGKLPQENKAEIEKRCKKDSTIRRDFNKDDPDIVLFGFVTKLPEDVQRIVFAHMLNPKLKSHMRKDKSEKVNHTLKAAKLFYDMPLSNAFNCYGRAGKILEWKEYDTKFNTRLSKDPNFTLDVIFSNLKDLLVFARTIEKEEGAIYSHKELKSIAKIAHVFESSFMRPDNYRYKYNCYEPYTLDNYKNQYSREQLSFLPFLLAPFVSRLIAKDYVYKDFSQSIIDSNIAADSFNQTLAEKVKNIDDAFWSQYIKPIKETYVDEWDSSILGKKSLVYWAALPISFPFWERLREEWLPEPFAFICWIGFMPGFVTWAIKAIALYTMPTLIEPLLEKPFIGMACVTGLYAFIVSVYNVIKMRTTRSKKVNLKDLSELFKRHDIGELKIE